MVKHCRVDKTLQPTQCRVTLAVEVPFLRSVEGKSLEMLQGEHGQGPRTALAREFHDWAWR